MVCRWAGGRGEGRIYKDTYTKGLFAHNIVVFEDTGGSSVLTE